MDQRFDWHLTEDIHHELGRGDPFAAAMRATRMPMVITDPRKPDNPIVFVNNAFQQLTGYERNEIIGRNCRFLQGPDTDQEAIKRLRTAIQNETDIQIDLLNYRKDGSTFWNALYLSPTRGMDGAVQFFFASQLDISERVAAHRAVMEQKVIIEAEVRNREKVQERLERANALAENAVRQKSEFVANMSHELRTPLTGILGLHDLLECDPAIGPKQRRYLVMARDAGRGLLAIVNDVLDFSKIEAGELTIEKEPFSLLPLVEACRDITAEAANVKSLDLDIKLPDCSITLLGDAARLKQILLNLLTNAIKFTDHGTVTATAAYNADTGRLRFEVTDTGVGIPKDKLPLLFKRFTQADASITRRYGGTGLGLAICQRLAELMKGDVGVTSEPGRGSTFWFEVPTEMVSAKAAHVEAQPAGIISPRRVLLAEDNLVNQEIIKAMLEVRGHKVTLADNGVTAAASALSDPAFDIILMDLQMPIMDGLSATRAIRSAEQTEGRERTPIIGLTANAMMEDVERCLEAGMEAHVAKPIEWADLFAAIEHVARR